MSYRRMAIVLALVSVVALAAWASDAMVSWKSQDVELTAPVRAGSVMLPAGEYRVTHEMQGEQHMLVMERTGKDKQTFRVPCLMQPLTTVATQDEQHYRWEGKQKILVGLLFKGDKVFHALQ